MSLSTVINRAALYLVKPAAAVPIVTWPGQACLDNSLGCGALAKS
jgi:hypothetical protein